MTKNPWTLKQDIYAVLNDRSSGQFTEQIARWVGEDITKSLLRQFGEDDGPPRGLRLSSLGTQCERKLWYSTNQPDKAEPLQPHVVNKFIYGDLVESYALGLVMASGHDVTGMQGQVDLFGIKGHRDCIIDGMLFDVKSASSRSMEKFRDNGLRGDDPFGYLSQLSSYLYGSQDDPDLEYKTQAGFLAIDKQFGHIEVDIYDLSEELDLKELEVKRKIEVVNETDPPDRNYEPVPHGKSGNMKLPTACSYCDFKQECWPGLRTFVYSNSVVHMTHVEREPDVWEVPR